MQLSRGLAPKATEGGTSQRKPFRASNVPARRRAVAPVTGRFPDGCAVEVRYPLTPGQAPDAWPWLAGTVLERRGSVWTPAR